MIDVSEDEGEGARFIVIYIYIYYYFSNYCYIITSIFWVRTVGEDEGDGACFIIYLFIIIIIIIIKNLLIIINFFWVAWWARMKATAHDYFAHDYKNNMIINLLLLFVGGRLVGEDEGDGAADGGVGGGAAGGGEARDAEPGAVEEADAPAAVPDRRGR